MLYDLGVSSPQLDEAERGFSYHQDAPLDMRMDQSAALTAYEVVNQFDYHQLVKIFFSVMEKKNFQNKLLVKLNGHEQIKPIETTGELVEIIKTAIPARRGAKADTRPNGSSKPFRIAVNDELGVIEESLEQAIDLLEKWTNQCYHFPFFRRSNRQVYVQKLTAPQKDVPQGCRSSPKNFNQYKINYSKTTSSL